MTATIRPVMEWIDVAILLGSLLAFVIAFGAILVWLAGSNAKADRRDRSRRTALPTAANCLTDHEDVTTRRRPGNGPGQFE